MNRLVNGNLLQEGDGILCNYRRFYKERWIHDMSWDVVLDRNYPCPCGKGEYREITEMDDWNRYRCEIIMLCPECKENYDLVCDYDRFGFEKREWRKKKS